MVVTVRKSSLKSRKPKIIHYRDYNNFNKDKFKSDLKASLNETETFEYTNFENAFCKTMNTHAPMNQKTVRANHAPYVTKALRKAIMKRSELETKIS